MAEKWFISDTHFKHANIIKYCNRPFKDTTEMDEILILNWNRLVKPEDKVYHLGDVACGYGGDDKVLGQLLARLNGHKRLVVGNHDNLKSVALQTYFEKMEMWYGRKEWGFTCTHVPYMLQHLRDGAFNVHGHVHNNSLNNPFYFNVSVEVNEYSPVSIDTILAQVKKVGAKNEKS